jgi:hypothetical protein
MANASGSQSVNLSKGKHSHLIMTDPDGRFTKDTTVTNPVTDTKNGSVTFTGEARWNKGGTANRLAIRLTGNFTLLKKDDTPPTDGSLSVTLMNGGTNIPTNNVTVQYVNDDGNP